MPTEDLRRRSHWMLRVLEWNDPKARYPNLWHEDMPRQVLVFDTIATRLRLGDLIAIFYPQSPRHPRRAERYLGLSRVIGLRRATSEGQYWLELETAHRLRHPLDLGEAPRRVFLCCDSDWPAHEVALFGKVFDAAVAEGWNPRPEETALPVEAVTEVTAGEESVRATGPGPTSDEASEPESPVEDGTERSVESPGVAPESETESEPEGRLFAGIAFSGDRRDPRDGTWLAVMKLHDGGLRLVRLEATGRHGLQGYLRNPDRELMHVEATGCAFPFGLPLPFAEGLTGGSYPGEGWWGLARFFERLTYTDYLVRLQDFRDTRGEVLRFTDECAGAGSPLQRADPDLGLMAYHGIRMIAEERSRFAVRPFESAQGRLLLEVDPTGLMRKLDLGADPASLKTLANLEHLPVTFESVQVTRGRSRRLALSAVLAARATAVAVLSGETEKTPEELSSDDADRVRKEGWIYGVEAKAISEAS